MLFLLGTLRRGFINRGDDIVCLQGCPYNIIKIRAA